jgi:hypothetical protein
MLIQDGCGPLPGFEETWSWWKHALTIPELLFDPPLPFFHLAFEVARQHRQELDDARNVPRRVRPAKRLVHAEQLLREGTFLLRGSDPFTRGFTEYGENLLASWGAVRATLRGAREAERPEKRVPRGFLAGVRQLWARHPELGTPDEEDLTDLALAVGFEDEPRLTRRKLLKRWRERLRYQGW